MGQKGRALASEKLRLQGSIRLSLLHSQRVRVGMSVDNALVKVISYALIALRCYTEENNERMLTQAPC